MTAFLVTYGTNPTDRLAAYRFNDREAARTAANPKFHLVPGVPPGSHAGGCSYIVENEEDVTFSPALLVAVFNGLTDSGVKRFETRAIGVKRLLTVLPTVAMNPPTNVSEDAMTGTDVTEAPKTDAKTPKGAKTPKEPKASVKSPMTRKEAAELAEGAPKPAEGMKSGAYIRHLVQTPGSEPGTSKFSTREVIGLVRHHFKDSSATASDVSWNRGFLKKAGTTPHKMRHD